MVLVKANPESEAGAVPSEEVLADTNKELVTAGVLLASEGLHPSVRGVRLYFSGKERHRT